MYAEELQTFLGSCGFELPQHVGVSVELMRRPRDHDAIEQRPAALRLVHRFERRPVD